MEAFFVAVSACILLGVGAWALAAMRRLLGLTQPDPTQADPTSRRPGDD